MTSGFITKNFSVEEISSRGELHLTPELISFVGIAQELRDWAALRFPRHAKNGLIISNCYRTAKHNKDVGGSTNSAHLDGRAMDITNVQQATFDEFRFMWEFLCSKYNRIGGINYYTWGIHITDYENKFGNKVFQVRDYRI